MSAPSDVRLASIYASRNSNKSLVGRPVKGLRASLSKRDNSVILFVGAAGKRQHVM